MSSLNSTPRFRGVRNARHALGAVYYRLSKFFTGMGKVAVNRLSIRGRLALMVLALALPLNMVIVWVIWDLVHRADDSQRTSLLYTARSIAAGVDAEIGKYMALAESLARSPELLDDNIHAFEVEARREYPAEGDAWALVADVNGQQLMNTLVSPGQPLPRRNLVALEAQQRALATRSIVISGIMRGTIAQDWIATIEVPIFKNGQPFRVLAVAMRQEGFLRLLNAQHIPTNWLVGIIDGEGRFIARAPQGTAKVGQLAVQGWRAIKDQTGLFEYLSLEGEALIRANIHPSVTNWAVGVAVKKAELQALAWHSVRWAALMGVCFSAASLLLAGAIARQITIPIEQLRRSFADISGEPVQPVTLGPPEIMQLQNALYCASVDRADANRALTDALSKLLAKKSAALARLHEISSRLWLKRDLCQALDEILAGAIELLCADMGIIRILDPARGVLKIEAHRGIKGELLDSCLEVSAAGDAPCGRTLRSGKRIVITDVEADQLFIPFHPHARSAGFRAAQSTPIMSREGLPLGTLTTHFRQVHKPAEQDLYLLDLYVRQAADIIERHNAEDALRKSEERLRLAQLKTGVGIWDWDLRTGRVTWTPELTAIFGLEPESVKCYADFRDRVHPDDIEAVESERDAAVRRHETFKVEFRIFRSDGQVRWILAAGGAVYDEATGEPIRVLGNNIDITERKELEDHKNTLISELDHRVKNVLATVLTVASRTQETSTSPREFVAALNGRIKSMATTQELLSHRRWQGIPLEELVRRELAPYATARSTRIDGPDVVLSAEAGQTLAMVFHELATNAAKFGAVSVKSGCVFVRWSFRRNGHAAYWLCIDWEETGGPHVVSPTRSGFGSSVIRELIPYELGGTAALMHLPEGVRCRLEIPAHWLSSSIPEEQSLRAPAGSSVSRA